jgi:hypothetical protein
MRFAWLTPFPQDLTNQSTNRAKGCPRRRGRLKQAHQPEMQPAASWENRRDSMAGQKERQKSCPIDKIAARQIAENGRLIAIVFLGLN